MSDDQQFGGIFDGLLDGLLKKYGIEQDTVKKISNIISTVADHVSTQPVGDEVFVTIHLDKIHFKFKKG